MADLSAFPPRALFRRRSAGPLGPAFAAPCARHGGFAWNELRLRLQAIGHAADDGAVGRGRDEDVAVLFLQHVFLREARSGGQRELDLPAGPRLEIEAAL